MSDYGLETPEDYGAAYELLRDEISSHVIGHDQAVRILALTGTRHLAGVEGQRLMLVGPSGSGKTTLARALAEAMSVPWQLIDVTMVAEQNWSGQQLTDYLQTLVRQHGAEAAARSLLVLDEIDKIAAGDMERSSRDYRVGKQQTLLPLLGTGSVIPLPGGSEIRPDGMLIIMAGVWNGLPEGPVTPGDLLDLGLLHEVVERLGQVVRLDPLEIQDLVRVLSSGLTSAFENFHAFGYQLAVPESTLRYVAAVVNDTPVAGPRAGVSWLQGSADRQLIQLIEGFAPAGTRVTLRPDDVLLPPVSRRDRHQQ